MGRHSAGGSKDPEQGTPDTAAPADGGYAPGAGDVFLSKLDRLPPLPRQTQSAEPMERTSLPGALGTVPVPQVAARQAEPKLDDVAPQGRVIREETRTKQGRRTLLRAGGVIVLVAAVAGGTVALVSGGGSKAKPAAAAPAVRTQHTLLLSIGTDETSALGVLIASDPTQKSSSLTLLPSRLLASVAGRGTEPLGQALATDDATVGASAVADLMGVLVDNTWALKDDGLKRLVDQLGGVVVDVDADVVFNGQTLVTAGPQQRLNGTNTLRFITQLGPDQDESVRLGHVRDVLHAIFTELPTGAQARADLLGSLGPPSDASAGNPALADFLASVGTDPDSAILPVHKLDSGGTTQRYRADPTEVKAFVSRTLAGSLPPADGRPKVRVYVVNGTGAPHLGAQVRPKLVAAGLTLAGSQNATSFDQTKTLVIIRDSSPAQRAAGLRVVAALGLPADSLRIGDEPSGVADVFVEVGSDLKL